MDLWTLRPKAKENLEEKLLQSAVPLEGLFQPLILRGIMFDISDDTEQKTFQQSNELRWFTWIMQVVEQIRHILLAGEKNKTSYYSCITKTNEFLSLAEKSYMINALQY